MERLPKDAKYHFISTTFWKVCTTTDPHFGTDDERFEAGNYFPEIRAAVDCFDEIDDKYGKRLKDLREGKDAARRNFLSAATEIAYKGRAALERKPEKKKKNAANPNFALIVQELSDVFAVYQAALADINDKTTKINEEIAALIKAAPKTR